jgi:transcriptional regulator with XRE-family HTH domain
VSDLRAEVRAFLASRRARLSPEQAGVALYGGRRRVPGLRREEVAALAGVSTDYYARLEKGNLRGVSDSVLNAVAAALQLDDVERTHLLHLAGQANRPPTRPAPQHSRLTVRPEVQRLLDSVTGAAAFVRNGRLDVLATNSLAAVLYAPVLADHRRPPNLARFIFLNRQQAAAFYRNWDGIARDAVGSLRAQAGRDPHDRALSDLIGELSLHSEPFRVLWAGHDVRAYRAGIQPFHHPVVGDLDLSYEALEVLADPGHILVSYTAEPGTASHDALTMLASWAAAAQPPTGDGAAHIPSR